MSFMIRWMQILILKKFKLETRIKLMKEKLKVMTVVGTRPEIIRLARVMSALDNSEAIEHIIVHTGQNYDYELNQIFFDDLAIRKPDFF
jgi:UDP-N-acetylglucosamine 2-epimerase